MLSISVDIGTGGGRRQMQAQPQPSTSTPREPWPRSDESAAPAEVSPLRSPSPSPIHDAWEERTSRRVQHSRSPSHSQTHTPVPHGKAKLFLANTRKHGSALVRSKLRAFICAPPTTAVMLLLVLALCTLLWILFAPSLLLPPSDACLRACAGELESAQYKQQDAAAAAAVATQVLSMADLPYPPPFTPAALHTHSRFVALMPIPAPSIASHIASLPLSWFQDVAAREVKLFYVIGRQEGNPLSDDELIPPQLRGLAHLLHVDCTDDEYPPIAKELLAPVRILELYGSENVDALVKFDSDTYVEPERLRELLQDMVTRGNEQRPLYSGRPLHHCQCHPRAAELKGGACTAEMGVNYCSGAFYALNGRAARLYQRNIEACLSPPVDRFAVGCRSSDTWFGFCMNLVGVACTPAVRGGPLAMRRDRSPPRGISWGKPSAPPRVVKQAQYTQVCQDASSQGGVADRGGGEPYNYRALDWEQCVAWHPLKSPEDMRYAAFASRWATNTSAPYEIGAEEGQGAAFRRENSAQAEAEAAAEARKRGADAVTSALFAAETSPLALAAASSSASLLPPRCRLAIGVLSVADRPLPRDAIRSTWGRVARALGGAVQLYFVIGARALAPHTALALRREMAVHDDIIRLPDVDDGYASLFPKTLGWLQWGSTHTDCEVIFKTDDDTYLRIMPLLTWMRREFGKAPPSLRYFGWQWGDFDPRHKQSPVVNNTASPFHMADFYPHKTYPPYMSGGGYGLSADLARMAVENAAIKGFQSRVEDAGVGVCVSRVNEAQRAADLPLVSYHTGKMWDYRLCLPQTILDNPAYSHGFNMYTQFEHDLTGQFCARVRRGDLTAPGKHEEQKPNTYDFFRLPAPAVVPVKEESSPALPVSLPPWHPSTPSRISWLERSEWRYLSRDLRTVLGGTDVQIALSAADRRAAEHVIAETLALVTAQHEQRVVLGGVTAAKAAASPCRLVSAWKASSMQRPDDFLLLTTCASSATKPVDDAAPPAAPSHSLVYVPFTPSLPPSSFSVLSVRPGRVAVVVPFACAVDRLRSFLEALLPVAQQYYASGGGAVSVVVAWHDCEKGAEKEEEAWRKTEQTQLSSKSLKSMSGEEFITLRFGSTSASASVMPVRVVRSHTVFARAASVNLGLDALPVGEVAVVLDIDMRIQVDYLTHALAFTTHTLFTSQGQAPSPPRRVTRIRSVYFPICFSRFNPALVPPALSAPFKVASQSGVWRQYGFGMVALRAEGPPANATAVAAGTAAAARPAGSVPVPLRLDSSIHGWGHEDVQFHKLLVTLPDVHVVRAVEPYLVHLWHVKDCSPLKGTDRYRMCIGSKVRMEGTARQIAEAYWTEMDRGKENAQGQAQAQAQTPVSIPRPPPSAAHPTAAATGVRRPAVAEKQAPPRTSTSPKTHDAHRTHTSTRAT